MSQVFLPKNLKELWELLEAMPQAAIMAGGTDLLVKRRGRALSGQPLGDLICLERLAELAEIAEDAGGLRVGALASFAQIERRPLVAAKAPLLALAAASVGAPAVRNMGTLGGNVGTASPAGDSLPALCCLEARVELLSRSGRRLLPLAEFILGPGQTALAPGEIIAALRIPAQPAHDLVHFEKVGRRKALAVSVASLAALVGLEPDGTVNRVRLALGSLGPTVVRPVEAERFLLGKPLVKDVLEEAAGLVRRTVRPIDDGRASAGYRRQVAGNLLLRLLRD